MHCLYGVAIIVIVSLLHFLSAVFCYVSPEFDITFDPKFINAIDENPLSRRTVNESPLSGGPGSQKPKRRPGSNLETGPRFFAVVASFRKKHGQIEVKIESVENAGRKNSTQSEELVGVSGRCKSLVVPNQSEEMKVRALRKSTSSIFVETNVDGLSSETDAYVDLFEIKFESGHHPKVEIEMVEIDAEKVTPVREMKCEPGPHPKVDMKNATLGARTGKMPVHQEKDVYSDSDEVYSDTEVPVITLAWNNEKLQEKEGSGINVKIVQKLSDLRGKEGDKVVIREKKWKSDRKILCIWPFLIDVVSENWLAVKKEVPIWSKLPMDWFSRGFNLTGQELKCWKPCMEWSGDAGDLVEIVKEKVKATRDAARHNFRKSLVDNRCLWGINHEAGGEGERKRKRKKPSKFDGFKVDGQKVRKFGLILPSDGVDEDNDKWQEWNACFQEKWKEDPLEQGKNRACARTLRRNRFFDKLQAIQQSNDYVACVRANERVVPRSSTTTSCRPRPRRSSRLVDSREATP